MSVSPGLCPLESTSESQVDGITGTVVSSLLLTVTCMLPQSPMRQHLSSRSAVSSLWKQQDVIGGIRKLEQDLIGLPSYLCKLGIICSRTHSP